MGVYLHAVIENTGNDVHDGHEYETILQIWRSWLHDFPSPDPPAYERDLKTKPPGPEEGDDIWTRISKIQRILSFDFRVMEVKGVKDFWIWVRDAESARRCDELIRGYYSDDDELLLEAARWLCHWADKGARFELSY